jgi:exodeoxyribonuclease VII large subunit
VTISDFVADVRAATPTNGAALAVPDQDAIRQTLDTLLATMASSLQRQLKTASQHLRVLAESRVLQSPEGYFQQKKNALELMDRRLLSAQETTVNRVQQRFLTAAAKLDALSPLKVLTRGYAIAQLSDSEAPLRSVEQVANGDRVRVLLNDGQFDATVLDRRKSDNES